MMIDTCKSVYFLQINISKYPLESAIAWHIPTTSMSADVATRIIAPEENCPLITKFPQK